jgi:predicted kinase
MKTPISKAIEADCHVPRLEMDAIRVELFPDGSNSPDERQCSYAAMHYFTKRLLWLDVPRVLLVATYRPQRQRQILTEIAESCRTSILVIQLKLSPEDAKKRFLGRPDNHPARDLTVARVQELAHTYRYYDEAQIVDTSKLKFEEVLIAVKNVLNLTEGNVPGPLPKEKFAEWVGNGEK